MGSVAFWLEQTRLILACPISHPQNHPGGIFIDTVKPAQVPKANTAIPSPKGCYSPWCVPSNSCESMASPQMDTHSRLLKWKKPLWRVSNESKSTKTGGSPPLFCKNSSFREIPNIRLPWWLRWWRIHLQCWRPRFGPWVGKIFWRREWLPTPVFLPGESHGQRTLAGYSPRDCKESDTTERLVFFTFNTV